jgi:hypothetical protein
LTSSLLSVRRGSQTPRVSHFPQAGYSSGQDAVDLAAVAGLDLDPWQQYVLQHSLGEQPNGKWAASEVACFVPRQNGKGSVIEARVMAGLFVFGEKLIVWTAHEYKTAQEGFLRIRELIRSAPELDRLVKRYWEGSGEQGIELTTGQRLRFLARSKGSGRGFSGDTVILDEAQWLTLEQMKALFSTLSAKPNPQVWYLGTPPDDPAAWIYGVREDGERGKPRLAYFDWGLDLDPDDPALTAKMADRELWYQANPALGIRLTEEYCEDELSRLREGFAPERLGIWLPRATGGAGVIAEELWRDQVRPKEWPSDVAFAAQVNYRRTHTSIAAVGPRADGTMQVSIVAYERGTHWVVDKLVELKAKYNPVAIAVQDKGPTGSLLLELEKVGIVPPEDRDEPSRADLAVPWAQDVAAAYGMFVDAVHQRRLVHLDEGPLNVAIAGAEIRALGGGTAWDYKGPVDVSPLEAATLAHWTYLTLVDKVNDDYDVADSFLRIGEDVDA